MPIRPATPTDAKAISDIWNPVIRDTVYTFTNIEKTVDDLVVLIQKRAELSHGFYVATDANGLCGFATYGRFRNGPGYDFTMEHSIFLSPDAKGKGIGKALMQRLETHAHGAKVHSLIAALSAENQGAIGFHAHLGYSKVAEVKQAGFKFHRWHDLVLMQKLL